VADSRQQNLDRSAKMIKSWDMLLELRYSRDIGGLGSPMRIVGMVNPQVISIFLGDFWPKTLSIPWWDVPI
jgi:hypothetical protein